MSAGKRGLGRGLDALFGSAPAPAGTPAASSPARPADHGVLRELPIDRIQRGPWQPRRSIDHEQLDDLTSSIRAQGVVQPILVRAVADGGYEIIAGERRWRAAQQAGLARVPALVRDIDDRSALAVAIIENIQRADLNPMEEAYALRRLADDYQLTHQQVADAIGRSRTAVTNLLRLLDLSEEVREWLLEGRLEMGHARSLLPLAPSLQREVAQQVMARGLTVRETEALVRRLQQESPVPTAEPAAAADSDLLSLEQELADRLGTRVDLRHRANGRGQVVIHYGSLDQLDGILAHMRDRNRV